MLDVQNVNGGRGPKIYSGIEFSYFVDVTLLLLLTQSLNKKNLLSDRIQSTLWEDHNKSLHCVDSLGEMRKRVERLAKQWRCPSSSPSRQISGRSGA